MDKTKTCGLENDVRAIAFGRCAGTPGSAKAMSILVARMKELEFEPYGGNTEFALPYRTSSGKLFHNIVGVAKGKNSQLSPLLIGAHYDSPIDAPCADDNAAAVAIALSAGETLKAMKLERDVVIALFDAEEPPYFLGNDMGSLRFYHEQKDSRGIHAALVMDLVGHDVPVPEPFGTVLEMMSTEEHKHLDAIKSLLFMTGAESNPALAGVLGKSGIPDGLNVVNGLNSYVGDMSDHHVFREYRVPYLFMSCGHWEHYHQPTDIPGKLNYAKMARIAELLVAISANLAGMDMEKAWADTDTLKLETASIRRTLGPLCETLLTAIGLSGMETRSDVDAFVGLLKSRLSI